MEEARPGRLAARAGIRVLVALMLVAGPVGLAAASVPMGLDMGGAREATSLGAAPALGSYWVGPWTASYWTNLDNALKNAKTTGVTPVIHWYYWGDDISPSCVEYGCDGKTRTQWIDMTRIVADKIRQHMGGQPVIVVLENEFNKGGITDSWYAGTFDAHLEARAKTLKAVPGVKIALGFGAWGEDSWSKFPKAAAQSDYIGFQMMRGSTRDSESTYRGAAEAVRYYTDFIARTFQKPSFLYDLALSSYQGSYWERVQAETLGTVLDQVVESGATGLQGVVYRGLRDTYMDPKNYFGAAESHWGLLRSDGTPKPAWHVWKDKASQGAPVGAAANGGITFNAKGGNEWWVGVALSGGDASRVVRVDSRDDGGSWVTLPKQSWGDYAGSYRIEPGHRVQFRATLDDGRVVESCRFTHPQAVEECPPDVRFSAKGGSEWWVGVALWGADSLKVAKVESRDDGGSWVTLPKRSWGDYAGSYRVEPGHKVYFRATLTDGRVVESCGYAHPAGGDACAPTFSASFTSASGNDWWLQVNAKAEGGTLAGVDARVNGGAWTALTKQSWGAWAKSVHAPHGSTVEFRARSTDGQSVVSGAYAWPPR